MKEEKTEKLVDEAISCGKLRKEQKAFAMKIASNNIDDFQEMIKFSSHPFSNDRELFSMSNKNNTKDDDVKSMVTIASSQQL